MGVAQLIERSDVSSYQSYQEHYTRVHKKSVHQVKKSNGLFDFMKLWFELPLNPKYSPKAQIQAWEMYSNYWKMDAGDQRRVENFVPHVLRGSELARKLIRNNSAGAFLPECEEQIQKFDKCMSAMEKPLEDLLRELYVQPMESWYTPLQTETEVRNSWRLSKGSFAIMKHEALYQFAELYGAIQKQRGQ